VVFEISICALLFICSWKKCGGFRDLNCLESFLYVSWEFYHPVKFLKFPRNLSKRNEKMLAFCGRPLPISLYLNNKVSLSSNYQLIVAPWRFDVLKTNIFPRSEASRANMLVLRISNFQGTTIRPIVPRHKHCCPYCSSLHFLPRQFKNHIELFSSFIDESRDSQR